MVTMADMEQARFAGDDPRRPEYRQAFWRTPDSYPRGGAVDPDSRKEGNHSVNLQDQAGGQLNPGFVEWLQGVPKLWTSLEPLDPVAYHRWQQGDHWGDGEWPGVPRVASGVAHRVNRLRALGNGIVPAVVAEFLHRAAGN